MNHQKHESLQTKVITPNVSFLISKCLQIASNFIKYFSKRSVPLRYVLSIRKVRGPECLGLQRKVQLQGEGFSIFLKPQTDKQFIMHSGATTSGVGYAFSSLTHCSPVLLFYIPWKHKKTERFSDVFRGYGKAKPAVMG